MGATSYQWSWSIATIALENTTDPTLTIPKEKLPAGATFRVTLTVSNNGSTDEAFVMFCVGEKAYVVSSNGVVHLKASKDVKSITWSQAAYTELLRNLVSSGSTYTWNPSWSYCNKVKNYKYVSYNELTSGLQD